MITTKYYAFKLKHGLTKEAFVDLPFLPENPKGMAPTLDQTKCSIAELANLQPAFYDCCPLTWAGH